MANIHQVLSEGSAIQLGPVTVSKAYPRKPGDKNRFVLIRDDSGQGALKIWGPAANTELVDGQTIILVGQGPKGGLKTSEYNNKVSIDANECRIEFPGDRLQTAQAAPQQAHVAPAAHVSPQNLDAKLDAVARQCGRFCRTFIDELVVNQGFSRDEAIQLAQNAPSWFPLYWFGEKGI